ncbi:MAG: DUF2007 domain-containing protein [Pseudomonadota bacterium]
MSALVTLENYQDTMRAELARMKLESEGVEVYMHSMHHASLMGPLSAGGIRLQVPEDQAEVARRLLDELEGDLDAPDPGASDPE